MLRNPLLLLCSPLLFTSFSFAQDLPPAVQAIHDLAKRQEQALEKVEALKAKFQAATPDARPQIEEEFRQTVIEVRDQIFPAMEEQIPAAFAAAPEDPVVDEIADLVLQLAHGQNRYGKVHQIAEMILKHDPQDQLAVNLDGVARFAEHDFAGAVEVLTKGNAAQLLVPQLGERYLSDAQKYVSLWERESALREQTAAITDPEKQAPIVKLTTNRGEIVIELFEDEAPNTVANFISLIESKFYDGLRFHRVIPGFMAQGGCPNTRDEAVGQPGTGGPGYRIACECGTDKARAHFAGSLSMAHAGQDTGGSQFFLTHLPTSHLNGRHTVFGRVTEGLDVVRALQMGDQITAATVVRKRNHPYKPQTLPE
jgi:cyclophilin family peptidyl-prolyl cis-trans isomerase